MIASGTSDALKELANIEEKVIVEVSGLDEKVLQNIQKQKNVDEVSYDGMNLKVTYTKGDHNLVTLMDYLKKENITYHKIFSERPTLNDVFLELTGKELRD